MQNINVGVPQGSIVGPILFVLYVNDLDSIAGEGSFTIYADDTSIVISDKQNVKIEEKSQRVLNEVSNWFCDNSLFLNTDKTQCVRFHVRQKRCENISLKVNGTGINNVDEVKFLGVIFDHCFTWNSHCESLISKLSKCVYMFRTLRSYLSKPQLLCLYYAQVDSRMRYGICLWGCSTMASDVFVTQKKVLRTIFGLRKTDTCRNRKYEILTLTYLIIFEMAIYTYANKNTIPTVRQTHSYNTRQINNLTVPCTRYNICLNSLRYLGPKIFNKLPTRIGTCETVAKFKKELKIFLVDNAFYSLGEFFNCVV